MERESNPMQALCRSGCGFYGSPATDGLCSLCFKENLKKKQQLPTTPTTLSALRDTTTAHPTISHLPSSPVTDLPIDPSSSPAANNNPDSRENDVYASGSHSAAFDKDGGDGGSASGPIFVTADGEDHQVDLNTPSTAVEECSSQTQAAQQAVNAAENIAAAAVAAAAAAAASVVSDAGCDDKDGDKDAKKKKNRCATCRKKVGLTGFECRCGGLFCAIHRYSDKHDCSFNYREMGAQEIRRNNPMVVGEKIQKI